MSDPLAALGAIKGGPGGLFGGDGSGPITSGTAPQDTRQNVFFGGARKGASIGQIIFLGVAALLIYNVVKSK